MKVLVVDGFDNGSSGRRQFKSFLAGVQSAFAQTLHTEIGTADSQPTSWEISTLSNLTKYVYAYERNEYTDVNAITMFDKLDCIVVDVDNRLVPWGALTRPLLLLLKTAFFTNKPVFAAGGGIQFVSFVLSNGGKRIRVLNGEEGSDADKTMATFQVPKDVGPDDVFLDSTSGDFFGLKKDATGTGYVWKPTGSVGSHVHVTTANIKSLKYGMRPPSPRKKVYTGQIHNQVPVAHYPVKAIMRGEVKIRVCKPQLRHAAFKDFGGSEFVFLAPCNNTWNVDVATNGRNKSGKQYKVLAESERGPMVIEYNNIWACQFHVSGEQKYDCTYKILNNFVKTFHERICREGRIGISCEFLKNGDPNLKPSGGGMRPFSAPVSRKARGEQSSKQAQGKAGQTQGKDLKQAWGKESSAQERVASRPNTARSNGTSNTTKVETHDVTMLAQEGYATPRFASNKRAYTPRGAVRMSSNQDDVETRVGGASVEAGAATGRSTARSMARSTARSGISDKTQGFSSRLLMMGGKLGLNMDFAKKHNGEVEEEMRRREEDGDWTEDGEGDELYFDDVSGMDSWDQRDMRKENVRPPASVEGKTLDLSSLHNGIAWGTVKADSSPAKLTRNSSRMTDRTEQDERNDNRAKGNVVKVKGHGVGGRSKGNYGKFVEMQKKDGGGDWYIYDDGRPYVSKSERELLEENKHRRRGADGKGGGGPGFKNVVGKRSAMKLPDKHGVAGEGPYYGKVVVGTQIDVVEGVYHDKKKFMNQENGGGGWCYNGDRQKPFWAERKGRWKEGKSKAGNVNTD